MHMVRHVHPFPLTFAPALSIPKANLATLMALPASLKAVPLRLSAVSSSACSPEALQHDLIYVFNTILYELITKSGNNKERNRVVVQRNWLGF